jgi:hypothetical protein
MTALSALPKEAAEACTALAFSTNWPAEEWAIATRRLLDNAMPMDEMGLTRLIQLTLASQAPPSEIADRMVLEYKRALANAAHSR